MNDSKHYLRWHSALTNVTGRAPDHAHVFVCLSIILMNSREHMENCHLLLLCIMLSCTVHESRNYPRTYRYAVAALPQAVLCLQSGACKASVVAAEVWC